jgi:hypothetical protein
MLAASRTTTWPSTRYRNCRVVTPCSFGFSFFEYTPIDVPNHFAQVHKAAPAMLLPLAQASDLETRLLGGCAQGRSPANRDVRAGDTAAAAAAGGNTSATGAAAAAAAGAPVGGENVAAAQAAAAAGDEASHMQALPCRACQTSSCDMHGKQQLVLMGCRLLPHWLETALRDGLHSGGLCMVTPVSVMTSHPSATCSRACRAWRS